MYDFVVPAFSASSFWDIPLSSLAALIKSPILKNSFPVIRSSTITGTSLSQCMFLDGACVIISNELYLMSYFKIETGNSM